MEGCASEGERSKETPIDQRKDSVKGSQIDFTEFDSFFSVKRFMGKSLERPDFFSDRLSIYTADDWGFNQKDREV